MKQPNTRSWKVEVSFSPFENESQRDQAYRIWAKLFVQSTCKSLSSETADVASKLAANPKERRPSRRHGTKLQASLTPKTRVVA